ncbi:MAG TPA: penicillin-binding transpeptidase domain-containing protein [Candidatus Binatia bacterium]|nr:penicillin-binding transpeptidase domain-containing protein [Candidatus Binatia bacterium]
MTAVGRGTARRPISANVAQVGAALVVAFGVIAAGAGYWQLVRSADLSSSPDDPAVIAAARDTPRGLIKDRHGTVLASNKKDADGEPYRVYKDKSMSPVIGYASRYYGTAGLERAYNAQLSGIARSDPLAEALRKFQATPYDPQNLTLSISLPLQKAALAGLGSDRGAVVMLDPRTGQVLALASNPTFDASAIADPATAQEAWTAVNADPAQPLLPRATLGTYVPGSVLKIVTAMGGLDSGALTAATKFPQQPAAEKNGLVVSGFTIKDGHHPFTDGTVLDLPDATEVSCNIYYALAGLKEGGGALDSMARRLGFYAPLPFDLPTATSQLTNGGGPLPGGFLDDVELANAAYGQGETLVTPLQMALVASAVANGGLLMKPQLVTAISGRSGTTTIASQSMGQVLSAADDAVVKQAMMQAVEGKYGRLFTTGAAVPGIPTAGKSGTAQLGGTGEPHSWFIGFAPVDHPQIAIAVLVEHGGRGGSRASPLAGQLMKLFFDTEATS